jgi:glycosyltransferase involved in cell wall biosynthesis
MPSVSVIIPVHNAMPYLRPAIESICAQTLRDIEVIVLDDASTDGSAQYLASVRDPRVLVLHCERQGYASLLNHGLTLAQAELAARMDADDFSLPNRLERQVAVMQSEPDVVLCGCQAQQIDGAGRHVRLMDVPTTDGLIRYELLTGAPFTHPGVLYRVAEVLAIGGYATELSPAEDYDLWWRLAERGRCVNLPDILLHYRWHGQNVSVVQETRQREISKEISVRYMQSSGFAATNPEALLFYEFQNRLAVPTANHCEAYANVHQRFLDRCEMTDVERASIRLSARRICMQYARRRDISHAMKLRLLRLARRLDPAGMTVSRIAARCASQALAAIRGRLQPVTDPTNVILVKALE